ncbi:tetratricopeptide repeat protein [Altibacter sp.]|uniref:tetratricopeptide repeat-containing sensor histidine kinase n=1 Tax=Altibacter sp. TaxID=2024823 RepID=UPI000C94E4E4|nr:tetratricopeptide repeat protein [Altibacter sp.]MAP53956.1 hypothetical protein [Altibacter sp.]
MHKIALLIFLFFHGILFSQSQAQKIDSLLQVAETANDSVRLRIFNKVSFYYIFNDPPRAKQLLQNAIAEAKNKKVPFSEAELVNTYGIYYDVSGQSDSANYYFKEALALSQQKDFETITVMVINNLGMFHWNKGNYQEALDYFFQALKMNQPNTSEAANAIYFNNIGLIYQEMGQYEKAIEYHNKSLELRRRYNKASEIPASLNNIGINLAAQGKFDEAEKILKEAITTAEAANEQGKYFDSLSSLADLYVTQGKPSMAIPLFEEILKGRDAFNIDRRANLVPISFLIYTNNQRDNIKEASKYVSLGNQFLKEFPDLKNAAVDFYRHASETYFRTGNPKLGGEYLQRSLDAKEQIFSDKSAAAIADLETKYNLAQKEKDLAETRANLVERELEVEQKNSLIYGGIAIAIIFGLLGYLFFNQQRLKNKQLQKENELKTALARIETQNRLQEQRLRISRDLHDTIGSQLTFIISSIDTLKFGLRDTGGKTKEKLSNISAFASQTIYELRDTIWAMNKSDLTWEDLQGRISNFIEKAGTASANVDFNFSVRENVTPDITFSSVEGMNIYRIIQEAVHNALKHAEPQHVSVEIDVKENQYILTITDDGSGFRTSSEAKGNGLQNIQKRAADLGGSAAIKSEPGKGTQVLVTFNR